MRITNRTRWSTVHLRAIIERVALEEANVETRKQMHITIEYHARADSWGCSGEAFFGSHARPGWIYVRVPKANLGVDQVDFAFVVAHEMAHARGLRHDVMKGSTRYDRVLGYRDRYRWAQDYPIEERPKRVYPKKAPPTPEEIATRKRAEIAAKVKAWQTRVKRASTMLKKWERKLRTFDRRAEAAA